MNYLFKTFIFFPFIILSQHQIGHVNTTYLDPNRPDRSIETEIYYPSILQGDSTQAAQGQFPVIVFGHGFVMEWSAYQNLWEEIVPKGYIMVFPTTEMGLFSTDHQEFGWDLQFLVTKIQDEGNNENSILFNLVDNNTALMGHSMGGGAALLAADSLCLNGNTNLKSIIGLAPAESFSNGVSSINSAINITIPSIIFSGSQDGVTPPSAHHLPMYNNLSSLCKAFISITGGGHCYFANPNFNCDISESLSSTGISITREEQQEITFDFLNLWLNYTLKSDCSNFFVFQDLITNSNDILYEQDCHQNPVPDIVENDGTLTSTITGIDYQWYFNNSLIFNANEVNYFATNNGDYNVEVFFDSGCPTYSNTYSYNAQLKFNLNITPNTFVLYQNFPNPFNPITNIKYHLPIDAFVKISIFDLRGKHIKSLVSKIETKGYSSIKWDSTDSFGDPVSAGIYIYTIQSGDFSAVKKMILLK